jgi:hypothetical protein
VGGVIVAYGQLIEQERADREDQKDEEEEEEAK